GILTALMLLGTAVVSWWSIPLLALLTAMIHRSPVRAIVLTTAAAILSWALLLLVPRILGAPVASLGGDFAASVGVPSVLPTVLTIALPGILAASSAGAVAAWRLRRRPAASPRKPPSGPSIH
ncbi:MAG: hypothetical protein ACT4R6_05805, partial [Gemmatimonadaceae bacterium]